MPRLVRREPLSKRIKAYLDPSDWLIWIGEELNSPDWDEFSSSYAIYIGFVANVSFVVAQANSGTSTNYDEDSVFREASGPGWMKWIMNLVVLGLAGASMANAWAVCTKKRHYRLFEQDVEVTPQTPSARRVRVDSSPSSTTPLAFLKNTWSNSAAARAYPDAQRDVWEIAVWDPNPLCLELFCIFNPLHVILYYLNLPMAPLDPRPSVRMTTTILIGLLLAIQLWWIRGSFIQQIKDNAIITRGVLHEYNNKFVHPTLQKRSRDVGIQTISKKHSRDFSVGVKGNSDDLASEVVTYTPTTIINRTFRTNPNVNYASQYDPDDAAATSTSRSIQQTPSFRPNYQTSQYTSTSAASGAEFSSPIRPSDTPNPFRRVSSIHRNSDGGYLGVKMHAASPLRKSQSTSFIKDGGRVRVGSASFSAYGQPLEDSGAKPRESLGGVGERRYNSPRKREVSPAKRMSMPNNERPLG